MEAQVFYTCAEGSSPGLLGVELSASCSAGRVSFRRTAAVPTNPRIISFPPSHGSLRGPMM